MPINKRTNVTTSDDAQKPFDDIESTTVVNVISSNRSENKASKEVADSEELSSSIQGYYGLLSNFYFTGGLPTYKTIALADVNTWCDVEMTVDAQGKFDNRPTGMKDAKSIGHSGDGSDGSPLIFELDGLSTTAFCSFRASMEFTPEEDEGQLESRILFNRHSGTAPNTDFSIEEVSLNMSNGADVGYPTEPTLTFFVGDTIDTNGSNDAGRVRFQVKSNVAGIIAMRALTLYINK